MIRMQRVWIKREGRPRQKFVLVRPPWAKVGDPVTHKGEEYTVVNVQDEQGFEVKFPQRATARG